MKWFETITNVNDEMMKVLINTDQILYARPHVRGTCIVWASERAALVVGISFERFKTLLEDGD